MFVGLIFKVFGLKIVFFELLHAKPYRIFYKFRQKISFESETCKIEPTFGNMGPYMGPIWARPGPLKRAWARPGPLKSGKSSGETHPFFNANFEKLHF